MSTTKSPPPNENQNVVIEDRNGLIESNNEVVDATQDGSASHADSQPPATATADCSVNNGGCEQNCAIEQIELTGQRVIVCSCGVGFALDIDGTHCIGEYQMG